MMPAVKDRGWNVELPTETEWEYACRAGTETPFYFGATISSKQANFNGEHPYGGAAKSEFLQRTAKVGSYPSNALGLFDMHGNVAQWCKDLFRKGTETEDKEATDGRVVRGGAWAFGGTGIRSAARSSVAPGLRSPSIGFRVVVRQRQ